MARQIAASGAQRGAVRAVPGASPTVPTGMAQDGSLTVEPRHVRVLLAALADAAGCQERHLGRAPVAAAYRRLARALGDGRVTTAGTVPASPATAGGTGHHSAAVAAVKALDGSERKLLLDHIADTYPELAARFAEWLTEYHAAAAGRRKERSKEKYRERRRAKRQAMS